MNHRHHPERNKHQHTENQGAGQHIAGRLVRLAKLERATRMRAQYPSIDDGLIIEPYEW